MGINVKLLEGKIRELNMDKEEFANSIGMDRSTFYRKMKTGGVKFTLEEIRLMIDVLKISADEAANIFFTNEVA